MQITAKRKTAESSIVVKLGFEARLAEPKKMLQTTMPFLNHMLEHVIWRGEFNLEVNVEMEDFYLSHVVCEDIGSTMGVAARKVLENRLEEGVKGYGYAFAVIDEAFCRAVISFENRAYLDLNPADGVVIPPETENTLSEDLKTFFEGFVQGAACTLHLDILKGENGHHIWEATFRAFGEALSNAFELQDWRKGITPGVAGPLNIEVEREG